MPFKKVFDPVIDTIRYFQLATIDMDQIEGAALPLFGGWVPSNTVGHGLRPTFIPSGILIHPCGQTDKNKIGGNVAWANAYLRTKRYPDLPLIKLYCLLLKQEFTTLLIIYI